VGLPFRPWLMRILYRHALDVMERQRVFLQPLSPLVLEAPVHASRPYECDPQELIAERDELSRALACLNADQRRVIALRYGSDLSEAEIAHVLGWPTGTVKSRLNRAREKLRICLLDERG
jgi:RNA polymerase sigma factor (sigma-70 family)